MTRRERKERRLERRLEWAAKREAKVSAVIREGENYRGDHAFNTQPGHIPERARLIRREDRAFGVDAPMAAHHRAKADGIAHQLETTIFSDDEDAPERLREKIAKLEGERDYRKEVNKAYRRGDVALAYAIGGTVEQAAALRVKVEQGYSWQRQPYPSYSLTNLGANIRRLKGRLATIERDRGAL